MSLARARGRGPCVDSSARATVHTGRRAGLTGAYAPISHFLQRGRLECRRSRGEPPRSLEKEGNLMSYRKFTIHRFIGALTLLLPIGMGGCSGVGNEPTGSRSDGIVTDAGVCIQNVLCIATDHFDPVLCRC